jgi:hypothetical protein
MFVAGRCIVTVLALTTGFVFTADAAAKMQRMAHVHMSHVMESWKDTPGNNKLQTTAEMEAQTAQRHAAFAARTPEDLKAVQRQTRNVLNALDPSIEEKGPGRGYGVRRAAEAAAFHIRAATQSEDASENVRLHGEHAAMAVGNATHGAGRAIILAGEVLDAEAPAEAILTLEKLRAELAGIVDGEDLDGDGRINWQEGGLKQARRHMSFMYKGEGMQVPE